MKFIGPHFLTSLVASHALTDEVQILPPVGYKIALAEMCAADGLLVLQSDDCNDQIPAKVYEYLRAQKPILGICGNASDTADVLRQAGFKHLAPLEQSHPIGDALVNFLDDIRNGVTPASNRKFVESASRRAKAGALADLFDEVHTEHVSRKNAPP